MEFVINLTTKDMARATDWCGVRSGKDYNKFEEMHLTPGKSTVVSAPLIEESPLCIECRVKEIMGIGTYIYHIRYKHVVRTESHNLLYPANWNWRKRIRWSMCTVDIMSWEKR